jgi:monovalent cation/proton antiporter MnhG/PhaG subunit
MTFFQTLGVTLLIFGVLFSVLGVVGVLRLPNIYARLHASGNTSTLGIGFLCLGAMVLQPQFSFKLITLLLFIVFTGPVASHAIATAEYRREKSEMEKQRETQETPVLNET